MQTFDSADALARSLIERTGGRIRLALPLGLGKANTLVNALTRAALADADIHLSIFTALTLERPAPSGDMEKRFLGPAMDRLFGRYPPLLYATLLRGSGLPANIEVHEFFMLAARWLGVERMQQDYISANYTHALSCLLERRPNVLMQLVAREGGRFSISCNTDITADLLKARREGRASFIFAGEINTELPFLDGTAVTGDKDIDLLLDDPATDFELFSVVKRPVTLADHAIGFHASRLVRDGGTLQIGIGSVGDALAHALILRHRDNRTWRNIVDGLGGGPLPEFGGDGTFETGLYACSEMLVDGLLRLFEAGVIRREAGGVAIHAGFFVDCRDFYRRLRALAPEQRAKIAMMPVSFTNALYGDEAARRADRRDARFVNNCMSATLLGAVASDTLEDGRVVSGVGGQYDFVAQAFALGDARSVITLNATRQSGGETTSNIVVSHAQLTIPRHLRDLFVSEYGIADLRGKSDAQCIMAMLSIADSRFQDALADAAKRSGKLPGDFVLPVAWRNNTPERLRERLGTAFYGAAPPLFPFGTDFDAVEQRLLGALALLKLRAHAKAGLAALLWQGLRNTTSGEDRQCLARMDLAAPAGFREKISALALRGALVESRKTGV